MRVMKFGGASLRDGPAIERSMRLVAAESASGRVLLVVSAQEGVTAQLTRAVDSAVAGDLAPWDALRVRHRTTLRQLGLPGDLLDRYLVELRAILEELRARATRDRRLADYVLSFGERMSARVCAAVLRGLGQPASPVDAYDLGLTTTERRGDAALLHAPDPRLRARLEAVPGVPVVTGFLALDAAGDLTTLGPNGSDLTAVWLGEAVAAEEVVLWKAVEGFMTADPHVVPEARLIPALGREEAIEFALHGAQVLHVGCLEPAARGDVVVRVADVAHPERPGSRIEAVTATAGLLGIAHRGAVARYREELRLERDPAEQLAELSDALVRVGIEPISAGFSAREATYLLRDEPGLERLVEARGARGRLERGLASLALVGDGVRGDDDLVRRVHAASERAGIRLSPAPGTSGRSSLAWLCGARHLQAFLQDLHGELLGAGRAGGHVLVPRERRPARPGALEDEPRAGRRTSG